MFPIFVRTLHTWTLWSLTERCTCFKAFCSVPLQPTPFTLLLGALGAEWLQEAVLIQWNPWALIPVPQSNAGAVPFQPSTGTGIHNSCIFNLFHLCQPVLQGLKQYKISCNHGVHQPSPWNLMAYLSPQLQAGTVQEATQLAALTLAW